jgi:hypothetical protein
MNSPQPQGTDHGTEAEVTHVQAHYSTNRKLGHWTTARRFEVRAMRGHVVLDLRSPQIPEGDIEIALAADHSMIKLLVPDSAVVDHWDLQMIGRCQVKDGPFKQTDGTRRIKLTGQFRHGEIRIRRGGVAVLSAMLTREYVDDVYRAHKEGTEPTLADPARTAPGTRRPERKP